MREKLKVGGEVLGSQIPAVLNSAQETGAVADFVEDVPGVVLVQLRPDCTV